MKIDLHLYGRFRNALPPGVSAREVPEGTTVGGLFDLLGIKEKVYRMALVNGFRSADEVALHDGDEVHIFQPVGGG